MADFDEVTSLQWSRIFRRSQKLGLSPELQALLKGAVGDGMGASDTGDETQLLSAAKNTELKIRQLVRNDAEWVTLKPLAWKLFRLRGTAAAAAQLVELAYLYGTPHETIDVLAVLNEEGFEYYFALHMKVRMSLVVLLWTHKKFETLDYFLVDYSAAQKLIPVEALYVFWRLHRRQDLGKCFMYFQVNEASLVEAAKQFGHKLDLNESQFYLLVGQMAVTLGFNKVARRLLELIRPDQHEYGDAIQSMMLISVDKSDPATRNYFEKLKRESGWRERLQMISQFIEDARARAHERDIRRPALNDILAAPLPWIPSLPVSYGEMSRVLAANFDLAALLPGITQMFKENALRFHAPSLDAALWLGPYDRRVGDSGLDVYWHGVALLHQFVNLADGNEQLIWRAKAHIEGAAERWQLTLPYTWSDLHRNTCLWLARSPHISEKKREVMLRQLKVAADARSLGMTEIEDYLEATPAAPYPVIAQLLRFAREKGVRLLEKKLVQHLAQVAHFRNADLDRLWFLAVELNDFDLAWRTATLVEGRQVLAPAAVHPWSISGEKRTVYPFYRPTEAHVDLCTVHLTADERRLCRACIKIGPLLPELLAALDPQAKMVKVATAADDSFEAAIDKALNAVDWLQSGKKQFRLAYDGMLASSMQLPGFIQILPSNQWSYLYIKLGERLGLNAWGWQLEKLHERIEDLLPRIASRAALSDYSSKVARWLKQLTSEQRSAWLDVTQLSQKIATERGIEVLADFVARLALIINPAHVQALKSLRMMRAPVGTIWSLERWVVSDEYSQIRRDLGAHNRVPIAPTLKRSIIVPPGV